MSTIRRLALPIAFLGAALAASAADPSAPGTGTGLRADYFDNVDLTAQKLTRLDPTVDFDWGFASPDRRIGADTFAARWTGAVEPRYSEIYTFTTTADDGVRLWVDGHLLIDDWIDHGATSRSGSIALTAGTRYDLRLEYYERGFGASVKLAWSSLSQALEIVPQRQLYPAAGIPAPTIGDGRTVARALTHGSEYRTYLLHVPASYVRGRATPVVLACHYLWGNSAQMEALTKFSEMADQKGFIIAYPDAINGLWDVGAISGPDDVGFINDLLDALSREYTVDANRIYSTGMSNGAQFTYLLGNRMSDRLAAIAPVSGALFVASGFAPASSLSVLAMHGTADTIVPYHGIPNLLRDTDETIALWAKRDGCSPTPTIIALPDTAPNDGCRIVSATYGGGAAGTEVVLYAIAGGGHAWPGQPVDLFGATCHDIDATTVIWNFFAAHPRRGSNARDVASATAAESVESESGATTGSGDATAGSRSCGLGSGAAAILLALAAVGFVRIPRRG